MELLRFYWVFLYCVVNNEFNLCIELKKIESPVQAIVNVSNLFIS